MANKSVLIKIRRQNNPSSKPYWEEFELAHHPGMNVISSLMEIAANPVTREGKATTPITYDSNCLEEVCGSCAMLINGRARMACSALIDNLEQPVKLEPISKFPIVSDLATDRSVIFREPQGRQGVGSHRRHLRPWPRPAHHAGRTGAGLSHLPLHLLHLLHGSLPAVQ